MCEAWPKYWWRIMYREYAVAECVRLRLKRTLRRPCLARYALTFLSISAPGEVADAAAGTARQISATNKAAVLARNIVPPSGLPSLSSADGVSCRARAERAALQKRQCFRFAPAATWLPGHGKFGSPARSHAASD